MNIGLILMIIFMIVAVIILFKIIKSIIKAIFIVLAITFVLFLVVTAIVLIDANNFKNTLTKSNSTFILMDEDIVLTSFSINSLNFSDIKLLNVTKTTDDFNDERVFFVSKEALSKENVNYEGEELSPNELFVKIKELKDVEEKTDLFVMSLNNHMVDNPLFLYSNIKNKNITLEKKTAFVLFINYIPSKLFIIGEKINTGINTGKEVVNKTNQAIDKTNDLVDKVEGIKETITNYAGTISENNETFNLTNSTI
jgi:hypothetical protein